ncbi:MAG: hydrogenase formation protein HypD [Clostridiales bacterium]|nr:hydrogenase formation protein HypD [Clostridiales bacterium]
MTNNIYSPPLSLTAVLTEKLAHICVSPELCQRKLRFLEVCGTHTMSVYRHGLKALLPPNVELISGPGCPVCVTPASLLAQALAIAGLPNIAICSFGDMLRVPIAGDSLLKASERGCDIRLVTSPLEALEIAIAKPSQEVVFLAVGFETTAPLSAVTVRLAEQRRIKNFSLFSAHRLMPPALRCLLSYDPQIDGLLLPGHVATISGADYFAFVPQELGLPAVVAGFEPADIMAALLALATQVAKGKCRLENAYPRAVQQKPNPTAWAAMEQVFTSIKATWRGLGEIEASGLSLRPAYADFDTLCRFDIPPGEAAENPACRCGDILRGELKPTDCPLFAKQCHPGDPQGACMVSSEGACAAAYRYRG